MNDFDLSHDFDPLPMHWILKDRIPAKAQSIMEWAKFKENHENSVVAQDHVGPFWISTVFLGIDHNHFDVSPDPILFETMVFDRDDRPHSMFRYSFWVEAEHGHKLIKTAMEKAAASVQGVMALDAIRELVEAEKEAEEAEEANLPPRPPEA